MTKRESTLNRNRRNKTGGLWPPVSYLCSNRSELNARAQLQDARRIGAADLPEGGAVGVGIRVEELGMVEQVEGLDAELKSYPFTIERRALGQSHVHIGAARTTQYIAGRSAVWRSGVGVVERIGIEE